jgi:hypothetical protein
MDHDDSGRATGTGRVIVGPGVPSCDVKWNMIVWWLQEDVVPQEGLLGPCSTISDL